MIGRKSLFLFPQYNDRISYHHYIYRRVWGKEGTGNGESQSDEYGASGITAMPGDCGFRDEEEPGGGFPADGCFPGRRREFY